MKSKNKVYLYISYLFTDEQHTGKTAENVFCFQHLHDLTMGDAKT